MNLDNLPNEMKSIDNWLLVKLVSKPNGKYDKVPVRLSDDRVFNLTWNKPNNLSSFDSVNSFLTEELKKEAAQRRFHGLGFVLTDTNFMCVDLDGAFAGDVFKPFAQAIVDSLTGFVESSISKNGLHIFVKREGWGQGTYRGKFEDGSGIDVLCDGTFVMVTGDCSEDLNNSIDVVQDFTVLKNWCTRIIHSKILKNHNLKEISFDHNLPVAGWTPNRIRQEIFPRLEDFEDRDRWRDVAFALHHQTEGGPEGLELFHEYSARLEHLYKPQEVEDLWKSIKLDPKKLNKTLRSLLHLVRQEIVQGRSSILGDLDNARDFRAMFEGEFMFCHSNRKWLRFTGLRWEWCQKGEEYGAAKEVAQMLIEKAAELFKIDPNSASAKAWQTLARSTRNNSRISAMLELAASEPGMSIADISELDSQPMLLGTQNGVFDLKAMSFLSPDPKLLISRQVNARYNNAATCPVWLNFLYETFLGDQDLIDYIQKAFGYSLTGIVSEEVLHFCFGHGKNGKSVMANVIVKIMGDYVQTANFDLLALKESSATNDIARLAGARLVMANETRENERLDDQKLKMLVSTEKLTARFMYGEFFEFWPQFKIWLRGNYKPIVTDSSEGAWRRLRLIPFEHQVQAEKTDLQLEEKLLAEKDGILAWMIDGCHKWQQTGLNPPNRIVDASNVYRDESDLLGEFLQDYCHRGPGLEEKQKVVFCAYRSWCGENGTRCPSQSSFTRKLGSRGIETIRHKDRGEVSRIYRGLCLTEAARRKFPDFPT